jgi:hypothetical protein
MSYSYKTKNEEFRTKYFYFMKLDKIQIENMKLKEGQKMKFFGYKQIFKLSNIVVWDIYSIMYYKKYYKKH